MSSFAYSRRTTTEKDKLQRVIKFFKQIKRKLVNSKVSKHSVPKLRTLNLKTLLVNRLFTQLAQWRLAEGQNQVETTLLISYKR